MDNLLYYPYINLPKTDWTARVLLYYDKIGSIVPQRYSYDQYDQYMKKIVDNKLIEAINPLNVLSHPWEVLRPFIEYVHSKEFKSKKRRTAFKNNRFVSIHQNKFTGHRIHADKFHKEVFYQLKEEGLAVRQDDQWFLVERQTAKELMTFLASVIGKKLNYQPTTDQKRVRYRPKGIKKDFEEYTMRNKRRELILNELIPFPETLDFSKLRRFKDEHLELLKTFKNKIELIVLNPTIEENSSLFSETIRDLNIKKKELYAKMNEKKLGKVFFGTACGIVSAVGSVVTAESWPGAFFGLAGVASAIYAALEIERGEDVFDQSGMKYLALVDKELRRSNS